MRDLGALELTVDMERKDDTLAACLSTITSTKAETNDDDREPGSVPPFPRPKCILDDVVVELDEVDFLRVFDGRRQLRRIN